MESLQSRLEELERDLSLAQEELSKMESHRHELAQMNDNLATAQKALIEKDTLLQEAVLNNTRLAEQILKTSSESEMIGVCNHLCNSITNHMHFMKSELWFPNPIRRRTKRQDCLL
ncbi:hypothetical protein C1646_774443 [Rhizophagus diaphanus]|nr:hypothetical protein C1646_774443 [Rhizophagus diaphanus] [Rhizophagus sp. MUCL 43196]